MFKETTLVYIVLWYTLAVCSTVIYLNGYFPVKSGGQHPLQDPPTTIEDLKINPIKSYSPIIDRLVIVVIDGIRWDFVDKDFMPNLMTLLKKSDGCLFKVHAEAPTVTMPRIKAITTGSVPQYIDIALNLGSRRLMEDSFLHRLKEMNKPIVFYGDNTWNYLFPNIFLRTEGVNSFYVNDYTEVDNNVTKHLPTELKRNDWKVMILHYLGLDHIGHIQGPLSPLINEKLTEMDKIINQIANALGLSNNTAILVTGDHGMRDGGSHGGTSHPEVIVPFAWIGSCPRSYLTTNHPYEKQTDIAVTISALMGLTYPADSVGRIISQLFDSSNAEPLLYRYYYNALTLIDKKEKHAKTFKKCFELHKRVLFGFETKKEEWNGTMDAINCYETNLRKVSDNLINEISRQIIPYLIIATVMLFWCLLALALPSKQRLYFVSILVSFFSFFIETLTFETKFSIILATLLLSFGLMNALPDFEKIIFSALNANRVEQIFGIGSIIGTLCLVSSSFVEEEHQIWLFFFGTFICYNVFKYSEEKRVNGKWIVSFIFLRFIRNLNKIGDQNSYTMDISDWLSKEVNTPFLKTLFIAGLLLTLLCIILNCNGTNKSSFISLTAMVLIYLYKMHGGHIYLVPLFWLCTILFGVFERKNLKNTIPCIWMQIVALFMRPWNVILIPGFYISSQNILKHSPSMFIKVMAHLWLIKVFYNGQGNDNSIGSIDISPGYIGFSDYYPVMAGIQIFCHYYAFFILGYMLLLTHFKTSRERVQMFKICTIYKIFDILYYCNVTIIHRNHLFIWSVFAPKLIVEAAHTLVLLIILYSYCIIKSF